MKFTSRILEGLMALRGLAELQEEIGWLVTNCRSPGLAVRASHAFAL
jgi:hypothetical protein